MILCKCGCGQELDFTKGRKNKQYISGHNLDHKTSWNKGNHHSKETKKKMSESRSGKKHWNYGKHHSEETKKKISESECGKHLSEGNKKKLSELWNGKKNPMFGKHHSEETKKKISKANKGKKSFWCGKHLSEETKEKLKQYVGELASNWKGGVSFEPYCPKFNNRKREEIRNQYNRKCYICNKDERDNITKFGKIRKLSVHHIDMDKEQGCNGKQWKLIPLCLHCHNSKDKSD